MSRAFTKERDDAPEPIFDTHRSGVPVRVTAAGRRKLADQLARMPSGAERVQLERLAADLATIEPPADRDVVAFGATVHVHAPAIGARRFTIVGAIEADIAAGCVSDTSPLGAALVGARAGDIVTWRRPVGDVALTLDSIVYDDAEAPATSAD